MDKEAVNKFPLKLSCQISLEHTHTLYSLEKSADEWIVKDFAKYVRTDGRISVMTYGDPLCVVASFSSNK